jgi:alcohol dehydrogenase class IV
VTSAAFPDLIARARKTSSIQANPVDLTDEDLAEILERAI